MDRFEDVVPVENGSTVYSIAMLGYHRVYIYENLCQILTLWICSPRFFPTGQVETCLSNRQTFHWSVDPWQTLGFSRGKVWEMNIKAGKAPWISYIIHMFFVNSGTFMGFFSLLR